MRSDLIAGGAESQAKSAIHAPASNAPASHPGQARTRPPISRSTRSQSTSAAAALASMRMPASESRTAAW